jgi:cysteine synthase
VIVANDVTELIGKTPMVRINKLTKPKDATIYAKLEWYNIGGSLKDRAALYILRKAEGRLKKKTILEATSGNMGIALAMLAAVKGYKLTIVMPESASIEKRKIIKAYGADLILSPGEKGTAGAIELKEKLLKENPERYVEVNQFEDFANILAHYETTGKEILEQTEGKVNMVVVGIETAGTGVGISKRLKEYNPKIRIVGVVPKVEVGIQGSRNPKDKYPTKLFKEEYFDEIVEIGKDEVERTFEVTRELARKEGLLVGMSSGAVMYVALKKAKELGRGKTIVAVLPDGGERYLSTKLFEG